MAYFWIGTIGAFAVGMGSSYFLYMNTIKKRAEKNFCYNERFLMFFIDICIAVIGFGLTLNATNYNEERMAKRDAVLMLEQASEYTDDRVTWSVQYYEAFEAGEITWSQLSNTLQINYDYYDNILANEKILQYVDMNTYGHIMQYLLWAKDMEEAMLLTDIGDVGFKYLKHRDNYMQKVLELIDIATAVMEKKMTSEEAKEKCDELRITQFNFVIKYVEKQE